MAKQPENENLKTKNLDLPKPDEEPRSSENVIAEVESKLKPKSIMMVRLIIRVLRLTSCLEILASCQWLHSIYRVFKLNTTEGIQTFVYVLIKLSIYPTVGTFMTHRRINKYKN